jgi:hypothetical protein
MHEFKNNDVVGNFTIVIYDDLVATDMYLRRRAGRGYRLTAQHIGSAVGGPSIFLLPIEWT